MSQLASLRFADLLSAIAAKAPTPGGGAVASAVGALSAALAEMVVAYSVGKKSLAPHAPAREAARHRRENARTLLLQLADEDAAAYGVVNELSRLPESDPRRAELPDAVAASVQVPQAVIAACTDLLRLMEGLAPITNRQLKSDLAIAAILAEATARASRWNILVNAPYLPDPAARDAAITAANRATEDAQSRASRIERACM
jgi:formiminotetrahydrofolate cyclodeaminase